MILSYTIKAGPKPADRRKGKPLEYPLFNSAEGTALRAVGNARGGGRGTSWGVQKWVGQDYSI